MNSAVQKTSITNSSFTINLSAGKNVICFKTVAFAGNIAAGTQIGLKITLANGVVYTNTSYTADPSANVAAKIKVVNKFLGSVYLTATTGLSGQSWGDYNIIPQDENGNFDINGFPKISSAAVSTLYYDNTYPKLFFGPSTLTPSGFQSDFQIIHFSGTIFSSSLSGNTINYINHVVSFNGPAVQTVKSAGNYAVIIIKVNVYNADNLIWGPHSVGFDPARGGWKFVGNPEMEMWTGDTPSQRIY
jgi:hypothetical protein